MFLPFVLMFAVTLTQITPNPDIRTFPGIELALHGINSAKAGTDLENRLG
jgi:hypothetical protein